MGNSLQRVRPFRGIFGCAIVVGVFLLGGCGGVTDTEYIHRAREHMSTGDLRAALLEAKNAVQTNPNNADARLLLGELFVQSYEGADAEAELRRSLELGISKSAVAVPLGRALLLEGETKAVLEDIREEDAANAESRAEILGLRGQAYFALSRHSEAKREFQAALSVVPGVPIALLGLARLAVAENDFAAARQYIAQVSKAGSEGPEVWLLTGDIDLRQSKFADAQAAFERLLSSKDLPPNSPMSAYARGGLARAQLAAGETDAALKSLDDWLKVAPNLPEANYLRALVAYEKGDLSVAADHLAKVLQVAPEHSPSMLLLGAVRYAQGHLAQANMYLSRYVATVPSNVPARKLLAATRLKLEQPDAAIKVLSPALDQAPHDAELLAMIGSAELGTGDYASGASYLEKAVAQNPTKWAFRRQLALAYLGAGNMDEAINELAQSAQQGDEGRRARLLMVAAYIRKGKVDEALQVAQSLVDEAPNEAVLQTILADVYMLSGRPADARRHFEKALTIRADFLPAVAGLATLDAQEGKVEDATNRLEGLLSQHPSNVRLLLALAQLAQQRGDDRALVSWLKKAKEADPKAVLPQIALARYYVKKRDADRALHFANNAVALQPDSAEVQQVLGLCRMLGGDARGAAEAFRKVVSRAPRYADGYSGLGQAQARLGQIDDAKASFRKVLELQADNLAATKALAVLELRSGNGNAALALARGIQTRFPERVDGFTLEGDLYAMQSKYDEAAAIYERATRFDDGPVLAVKLFNARRRGSKPDSGFSGLEAWLRRHPDETNVLLYLAMAEQAAGRNDAAAVRYERLLKLQTDNVIALNNLAWLYSEKKKPEALALARRAYALTPDDAAVADTYGWLLLASGDAEGAVAVLQKATERASDNLEVRYHFAAALHAAGDKDDARRELKKLLSAGTNFRGIDDARRLLETP